jgi:hypothetical protein
MRYRSAEYSPALYRLIDNVFVVIPSTPKATRITVDIFPEIRERIVQKAELSDVIRKMYRADGEIVMRGLVGHLLRVQLKVPKSLHHWTASELLDRETQCVRRLGAGLEDPNALFDPEPVRLRERLADLVAMRTRVRAEIRVGEDLALLLRANVLLAIFDRLIFGAAQFPFA